MKGGLLTHMLVTREMSIEEIYANVTEMLLAGVDTVCVFFFFACAPAERRRNNVCRDVELQGV